MLKLLENLSKAGYNGKQFHGHARWYLYCPTPIGVGIIPLTGIVCPSPFAKLRGISFNKNLRCSFSEIPQSSFLAAASGIPAIPIWRGTFAFFLSACTCISAKAG